jgi:hypothetical protein
MKWSKTTPWNGTRRLKFLGRNSSVFGHFINTNRADNIKFDTNLTVQAVLPSFQQMCGKPIKSEKQEAELQKKKRRP